MRRNFPIYAVALIAILFNAVLLLHVLFGGKVIETSNAEKTPAFQNELDMMFSNDKWSFVYWMMMKPAAYKCKKMGFVGETFDDNLNGYGEAYEICLDAPIAPRLGRCSALAFGINYRWGFEDDLSSRFGCRVFAFDPSMNDSEHVRASGVHFFPIGVHEANDDHFDASGITGFGNSKTIWRMKTISSISEMLNLSKTVIDVIKMDVEGAEVGALTTAINEGYLQKYVKQLTMEWHLVAGAKTPNAANDVMLTKLRDIYQRLHAEGFYLCQTWKTNDENWLNTVDSYVNSRFLA